MTPYEKALEIKERYHSALTTKDCALVCVDEIIEAVKFLHYGIEYINVRDYWAEVKEELEKI